MVLHKTWYSIAVVLLGLLFIATSLAVLFAPAEMIPNLLAAFEVETAQLEAFQLAFLGTNIRNLVLGFFMIYFAFKDTKILVVLLVIRFFIELLDLLGGLVWNPAIGELIPVFLFMFAVELLLIVKGMALLHPSKQP